MSGSGLTVSIGSPSSAEVVGRLTNSRFREALTTAGTPDLGRDPSVRSAASSGGKAPIWFLEDNFRKLPLSEALH